MIEAGDPVGVDDGVVDLGEEERQPDRDDYPDQESQYQSAAGSDAGCDPRRRAGCASPDRGVPVSELDASDAMVFAGIGLR
jgi:hypothetical protein